MNNKKFLFYWHNGRSLGHTVRSSTLATGIIKVFNDSALLGLTGASKGLDLVPNGMDIVKIPSYLAFDSPEGIQTHPLIPINKKELAQIRKDIIKSTIFTYKPDVVIIDHHPYGKKEELKSILPKDQRSLKILGLRGILDAPSITNVEFFGKSTSYYIKNNFHSIHVYTDPNIIDIEEIYDIPKTLSPLIKYTGYVCRFTDTTKMSAKKKLQINPDLRLVVVSLGGGQATKWLWDIILKSLKKADAFFDLAILISGPYTEKKTLQTLKRITNQNDKYSHFISLDNLPLWMKASDLFIGAGGYNTISEVIGNKVNSILIPRQLNEVEQEIHLERLSGLSLIRSVKPDWINTKRLHKEIIASFLNPFPANSININTNGAETNAHIIEKLLNL